MRDAKRRNESASARLLHGHLVASGLSLGQPRLGDPQNGEPDAVCPSPDGDIGIEATNVFYDRDHASWTWGLAIEGEGGKAPQRVRGEPVVFRGRVIGEMSPLMVNPHIKLAEAAQAMLHQKCAKSYSVPTYLILDARQAVIVTATDGPQVLSSLVLPAGCGLRGAYLCLLENKTGIPHFFEVLPAP